MSRRLRELGPHTIRPPRSRLPSGQPSCCPLGTWSGRRTDPWSPGRELASTLGRLRGPGAIREASSISSTTRPTSSATGQRATRRTGSERFDDLHPEERHWIHTLVSERGGIRRPRGEIDHGPAGALARAWPGPKSWVCASPSTARTSGHTKWAPRCRSWPRWRH